METPKADWSDSPEGLILRDRIIDQNNRFGVTISTEASVVILQQSGADST